MAVTSTLLSERKERMVVFDDSLLHGEAFSDVFRERENHRVSFTVIVSKGAADLLPNRTVNLFPAEPGGMLALASENKSPRPAERGDICEVGCHNRKDALQRGMHGCK